jgi:hypothetical protein
LNIPVGLLDQSTAPIGVGPRLCAFAVQVTLDPTTGGGAEASTLEAHETVRVTTESLPTVRVVGAETTVMRGLELSVTCSSNSQVPDFVKSPVERDGFEDGLQSSPKGPPRAL